MDIKNFLENDDIPHIDEFTSYKKDFLLNCIPSKNKEEFNEKGYRSDSFLKKGHLNILSIGCSDVFGLGLNKEERFSDLFCRYLKDKTSKEINNFNLGLPGKSNDYISRNIISTFNMLKPNIVIICFTRIIRREFFDKDGKCIDFLPNHDNFKNIFIYESFNLLSNKNNDLINFYKNYKLIYEFLKSKKTIMFFTLSLNTKGNLVGLEDIENIIDKKNYIGYFDWIDNSDKHHPGIKSNYLLFEKIVNKQKEFGFI